jgi:hypothetical protein
LLSTSRRPISVLLPSSTEPQVMNLRAVLVSFWPLPSVEWSFLAIIIVVFIAKSWAFGGLGELEKWAGDWPVIPAQAGIQNRMDSRMRGNDKGLSRTALLLP